MSPQYKKATLSLIACSIFYLRILLINCYMEVYMVVGIFHTVTLHSLVYGNSTTRFGHTQISSGTVVCCKFELCAFHLLKQHVPPCCKFELCALDLKSAKLCRVIAQTAAIYFHFRRPTKSYVGLCVVR
jgi:hypothetical protein